MVSLLDLCTCAQKWAPAPCVHTGFLIVLGQYTVLYLPLSSCFIEWTQHHFVPLLRHWFPVWAAPKTWQLAPLPTHTQLIRQYFCGPCITRYTFVGRQLCLRTPSQNPVFFSNPIQTRYCYILVSGHAAAVMDTIFTSWGCPLTRAFSVFAGKKYQFQMCRTDFTTWITETLYTHCLQVRYIPSFLAVQLCTLCHHYLVFLYMWLSVVAVILFSFVFCLILVILLSAPKSKSTKKSILLLHIQSMSKCWQQIGALLWLSTQ